MKKTTKKELEQAAKFLKIEREFMASHGWTEEKYIERYGTTEAPKMGDGGSLIWEADLAALFRARDHFLACIQSFLFTVGSKWEKSCPMAAEVWNDWQSIPTAIEEIHARRTYARRLVESMRTSNT